MALLAETIHIPNIDFFLLTFLSLGVWHYYFLASKTNFNFIKSACILSLIAFISPVFCVYLSIGIVISTLIIYKLSKHKQACFYSMITLILCGFCSLTSSLLYTQNVHSFIISLENEAYFPILTSGILSFIILCQQISFKEFIIETNHNTKRIIASHAILTFLGAAFIGRLDYIAHFI
jgi:hypothetical protein